MPGIQFGQSRKKQKSGADPNKELQKLRRMDLLELLVDEMRDNEKKTAAVTELTDLSERLKAKLDDKDAQIERLKAKLDQKDEEIAQLKERNKAIARAGGMLDVDALLEIEKQVVGDYLAKLTKEAGASTPAPKKVRKVQSATNAKAAEDVDHEEPVAVDSVDVADDVADPDDMGDADVSGEETANDYDAAEATESEKMGRHAAVKKSHEPDMIEPPEDTESNETTEPSEDTDSPENADEADSQDEEA